jgi:hypothetical protein
MSEKLLETAAQYVPVHPVRYSPRRLRKQYPTGSENSFEDNSSGYTTLLGSKISKLCSLAMTFSGDVEPWSDLTYTGQSSQILGGAAQ